MKTVLFFFLAVVGFSASAVEVQFKCSPKAFSCNGNFCGWTQLYDGAPINLRLGREVNNREFWAGRYQTILDGHQLTLDFRWNERTNRPVQTWAYLGAPTVMAETSGTTRIDIALRDNTYGRGFECTSIRIAR